ncbi:GLIPR1-like protein 1 [Crassostrea angulata]|uniref:GLIPR1-like protein 1 n=1 Tax=Magallana angulata TaxID=2784310 RepID=UPI0022B126D2|nr:GLIPR1-like protein 1 [Crassostrea angulata]
MRLKQSHRFRAYSRKMSLLILTLFVASVVADFDFLDEHNARRRDVSPSASNMRKLKWSNELADLAWSHAVTCSFGHNNPQSSIFNYVGQNIASSDPRISAKEIVKMWDNEKSKYNYYSNTCSGICGHYTQVNWANTEYVGCAVVDCSFGSFYVCNYGEGGNFNNARPYNQGTPCSGCPTGYSCENKLCV